MSVILSIVTKCFIHINYVLVTELTFNLEDKVSVSINYITRNLMLIHFKDVAHYRQESYRWIRVWGVFLWEREDLFPQSPHMRQACREYNKGNVETW